MEVFVFIIFVIFAIISPFLREDSSLYRNHMIIRNNIEANNEKRNRRIFALKTAALFLSPYHDIWNNLRIGNKYCYAVLKGGTIRCYKKGDVQIYFYVKSSGISATQDDLWDSLCLMFEYNTSYRGLLEFFNRYKCGIIESEKSKSYNSGYGTYNTQTATKQNFEKLNPITKIDINNCSEIEMTALPGINVIMSKRAIKKREEIGGFKKIEDFFLYLHIKPHIEKQLREKICINKMKGSVKILRNSERSVDL